MAENMSYQPAGAPKNKKIAIQDRAARFGNCIAINAFRANRTLLQRRLAEGGYEARETDHFLVFTHPEESTTLLAHWFPPAAVNANIGDYLLRELKPLGLLTTEQQFGDLFGAVVCSFSPDDPQRAFYLYGNNTLHCYQELLSQVSEASWPLYGTLHAFAKLYKRIYKLLVGKRFLDVGCSFGFLPLLVAERFPSLLHVVGVDLSAQPFPIIRALAEERGLHTVQFLQADLLSKEFRMLGNFETVGALHLLEHFSEEQMYGALVNLWKVTANRLIIAVPFEEVEPEIVYGHKQLFTPEKLQAVGQWCLEHLRGVKELSYEECAGGLLILERAASE